MGILPHPFAENPSTSWFKFGFPVFYVTDLLQNIEVLLALGLAGDPRRPVVAFDDAVGHGAADNRAVDHAGQREVGGDVGRGSRGVLRLGEPTWKLGMI